MHAAGACGFEIGSHREQGQSLAIVKTAKAVDSLLQHRAECLILPHQLGDHRLTPALREEFHFKVGGVC
jgi:hypothetical protein